MDANTLTQLLRQDREKAFRQLYPLCFPGIAKMLQRMGGTYEDARDIFHDSLIVLFEKAVADTLPDVANPKAYLTGIARHLWLRKKEQQQPLLPLENAEHIIPVPSDFYNPGRAVLRTVRFLTLAGKKCMELLEAFYYAQTPLAEISRQFGYANTRSATVQKFKCLEKIREQVKSKNIQYENLVEEIHA
ncbi:MAG TPA: sigma-70 family RNA polymerase sigma factor [Saprospiraceae bacterium]|nr:sigma-70 family RNA polymerase sigma factor [Saprospiraceae bacterium]HMQ82879.1 sigma-70 family RNA polymerase sigma factor [Saprospiraceae bacterium]